MTWQKVVRHISDDRIVVRSASGNEYPVETEYRRFGEGIYSQLTNDAHDKDLWAWVEFDDDPVLTDYKKGSCPDSPPWAV